MLRKIRNLIIYETMTIADLIQKAIGIVGSEAKLAAACGVSQPAINGAKKAGRVSARIARRIDEATKGAVPKHALCPDVFDAPVHGGALADPVMPSPSCAVAGQEGSTDGTQDVANAPQECAGHAQGAG